MSYRQIHDTLAQGLASLGMLLQAADRQWDVAPEEARRLLRQAAAAVNLDEARHVVRALAPPALASGSLPAALAELAAVQAAGPRVRFRTVGDEYPVDVEVQAALLRVAQGAVANAREHAAATTVTITLTYPDDAVSLDVADDGSGFVPGAASGRGRGTGTARASANIRCGSRTTERRADVSPRLRRGSSGPFTSTRPPTTTTTCPGFPRTSFGSSATNPLSPELRALRDSRRWRLRGSVAEVAPGAAGPGGPAACSG